MNTPFENVPVHQQDAVLAEQMPNLEEAQTEAVDLVSSYWTPQKEGESKRVFFIRTQWQRALDINTKAVIELECALFVEQSKEGFKTISNGSKRLVGTLKELNISPMTPLEVTYLGKLKNATNSFSSDAWSIRKLILKNTSETC